MALGISIHVLATFAGSFTTFYNHRLRTLRSTVSVLTRSSHARWSTLVRLSSCRFREWESPWKGGGPRRRLSFTEEGRAGRMASRFTVARESPTAAGPAGRELATSFRVHGPHGVGAGRSTTGSALSLHGTYLGWVSVWSLLTRSARRRGRKTTNPWSCCCASNRPRRLRVCMTWLRAFAMSCGVWSCGQCQQVEYLS